MPCILEFRVPLPLTTEEFGRGQLFMIAVASKEATKGTEGIVWLKNEPYDNRDGHMSSNSVTGVEVPRTKGQYTLKQYHFAARVPALLKALAPATALYLIEESWNAYPECRTVLISGYLSRDTLCIDIASLHVDDDISLPNALKLTDAELKARTVEYLDIRNAPVDPAFTMGDASTFVSTKTKRGPLAEGWEKSGIKPLMCCYKVVRAQLNVFGISSMGETAILGQQRNLFTSTLNKAYVTVDDWVNVTIEEIRALEEKVAAEQAASKALQAA